MRPSRAPVAGLCIAAGRLSGCSGTASPTAPDNSNSVRLTISRASLIFSPNRFGEVLRTGVCRAVFSDFALTASRKYLYRLFSGRAFIEFLCGCGQLPKFGIWRIWVFCCDIDLRILVKCALFCFCEIKRAYMSNWPLLVSLINFHFYFNSGGDGAKVISTPPLVSDAFDDHFGTTMCCLSLLKVEKASALVRRSASISVDARCFISMCFSSTISRMK